MIEKIVQWQTGDGAVFDTQEDAEDYQECLDRIELIESVLEVDCDAAIAIEAFVQKYIQLWK